MNNMQQMLKQAKKMQEQLSRVQEELATKTIEAQSGGGMVKAVVSGKQELISLSIEPEALEQGDKEMLEDLIVAAINEGLRRSREMMEEELSKVTGGFKPPFL
jgi:DNA-binding YbaB/EbfC family protein